MGGSNWLKPILRPSPHGSRPIFKKKELKPGFYFSKKSSLKDIIFESSVSNGEFWNNDFDDDDGDWPSICYDPSLDDIYGSLLNSHLFKSLSLESPIKRCSSGSKVNHINYISN